MLKLSSVQSLSHVRLFPTPWTAAREASLSITYSWSLLKLMSIESVMPYNHLIFCRPLLLPLSIFPRFRVFSNESDLHIRWPKYWSFSFSISPSNEYSGLISFRMDWLDLLEVQRMLKLLHNCTHLHASKVMLNILQARLQQYMNHKLPDAQAGFRKGWGTRDQMANMHWILQKAREFQKKKTIYALLTTPKVLTVWIKINCGKFLNRLE